MGNRRMTPVHVPVDSQDARELEEPVGEYVSPWFCIACLFDHPHGAGECVPTQLRIKA